MESELKLKLYTFIFKNKHIISEFKIWCKEFHIIGPIFDSIN